MAFLDTLLRTFVAVIFIVCQHALLLGLGLVCYGLSPVLAVIIWLLAFPMIYINKRTYQYVMKYGVFGFISINADTSEIDIEKGKRLYDQ